MEQKRHMLMMEKKILKTLDHRENFTKLLDVIDLCGLEEDLNGSGPFTLFAPTDNAFLNMPPGSLDSLMMDKARLTEVVKHHVVQDRITSSDAITSKNVMAMDGSILEFETCNGFKIGNATVVESDIECKNGLIQVVDGVILPKNVILDQQPASHASGDVKIVNGNGKIEQTMASGSQKMQDMKKNMKDNMGGMKDKMKGDGMSNESMTEKMKEKMDEGKKNMDNKKNEMKNKMDSEINK